MRKAAQKRANEHKLLTTTTPATDDHNYTGMEPQTDAEEDEFPPLPVTPSKSPAAKKPSPSIPRTTCNPNTEDPITMLANLINTRSDALEMKLGSMLEQMELFKKKVDCMEKRVELTEKNTTACSIRVTELERYSRRWNLRLHGVPEKEKEDAVTEVTQVCQEILPREKERLQLFIDVAHRAGKMITGSSRPRPIIIRFVARRYRDYIWKAAKGNDFLKKNGLRFTEDLCKEDRDFRQKLWPSIQKAQKEGKSAYFVGGRGFINGVEIPATFDPVEE